jgi:hypothetical protein
MAAFCGCCGAEITAKEEVCTVCGTPRHGMTKPGPLSSNDAPSPTLNPRSPLDRPSRARN